MEGWVMRGGQLAKMAECFQPGSRDAENFRTRHGDQGEELTAGDNDFFITEPDDLKRDPKAAPFDFFQMTPDLEFVAESGGGAVIDLGANHDRIFAGLGHRSEAHAHLFG